MSETKYIRIPYCKSVYGKEEVEAVLKCLNESTQMGKYARKFEREIANIFAKKESIFVNSGSSALYIGMEAFNFPKGSEIITPALTFSTTVGCIAKNNLIPVFVDVEPYTYCIDAAKIESCITDKTVAILAPNLIGNVCDWPTIRKIADKYNLKVLEDSADTLGATINGISSGFYSDMSITSFYGSHVVHCAGNGGALALNDEEVIKQSKLLRSWGRSSSLYDENSESIENRFNIDLDGIEYDAKFVFETVGYNLEGSEIGASFGLAQLKKLDNIIEIRKKNFNIQKKFFGKYPELFSKPQQLDNSNTAWMMYPIVINEKAPFNRREFQIYLEERNIQTRPVFTGNVIRQPICKNMNFKTNEEGYKNSDRIMKGGVLLPVHHGMTDLMFESLHKVIDEFISRF